MKNSFKSFTNFHIKYNSLFKLELKKIETLLDSPDFYERKNLLFMNQLKRAFKNNNFYSKYYSEHGLKFNDIKSIDDISLLPEISKKTVKENCHLIKDPKLLFFTKGFTSGTTGSPLVVYRSFKSVIKENAYVWWYRNQYGLHYRDPKVSIRGDLDRNKLYYLDQFSNTLYISSYLINDENCIKIFKLINDFKPKAFLGYPSSIYSLSVLFERNDLKISVPLAFTSSETLLEFQELKINNIFESKIFDWYGNAERTIALYRGFDKKYYEPPLYSINEYRESSIICTSLINSHFPLIRYKVYDEIKLSNLGYCLSKKSYIIESIEGRKEDFIILPDGSKIGRLDTVLKGVNNIIYSQIIQSNLKSIEVCIVPEKHYNDFDENLLLSNLRRRLGNNIHINIKKIKAENLIYSKSGKFRLIVSYL